MPDSSSWERDVLSTLQAPVTTGNLRLLRSWQRAEGGHTNNTATWNWLNTTRGKQFPSMNSVGVRQFPDYRTGVAYTADTIIGGYPGIVSALRAGKPYSPKFRSTVLSDFSKWVSGSRTARLDYGQKILGVRGPVPKVMTTSLGKAPSGQSYGKQPMSRNEISSMDMLINSLDDGDDFWDLLRAVPEDFPELAQPVSEPRPASPAKKLDSAVDLKPGAGWGGSKKIAMSFRDLAKSYGLGVMSEKRSTKMTASGGVSDHWTGSKNSYAFDLSNGSSPTKEMDEAARQIMAELGVNYDGKSELVKNVNVNGYRVQVLYRTNVGGNHHNHIHVGVRKL